MAMSVEEMLVEVEQLKQTVDSGPARIQAIRKEVKQAKWLIRDWNALIARYGTTEAANGTGVFEEDEKEYPCDICGKLLKSLGGIGVHKTRMHGANWSTKKVKEDAK